jgi:hypothetical protein
LLDGQYARQENDPRFTDSLGSIESVVTSSAQNDSGLFETNLRDERYLPFEGAGVISQWQIKLPDSFRQFDYDTITDLLLHVRYTAREGGERLGQQAKHEIETAVNELIQKEGQLAQIFSLRHQFPTLWHRFLYPDSDTGDNSLTLDLSQERFPFLFRDRSINVDKIEVFVKVKYGFSETHNDLTIKLSLANGDSAPTSTDSSPDDALTLSGWNDLLHGDKEFNQGLGHWTMNAWLNNGDRLDSEAIENILFVCRYSVGAID